mmetsp:Transcript_32767/g.83147  ORF Transcript_32767/g.83147 Transcript_32767/m.83147 type:complete len:287 (-) Transcript_32767:699-1559(-)
MARASVHSPHALMLRTLAYRSRHIDTGTCVLDTAIANPTRHSKQAGGKSRAAGPGRCLWRPSLGARCSPRCRHADRRTFGALRGQVAGAVLLGPQLVAVALVVRAQHGGQRGGLVEAHDGPSVPDEVKPAHVQVDLARLALGLQVHDVQHVLQQRELERPVGRVRRGQRWRRVHLQQPGLERLVDEDVVAVQLEAVLVVDHGGLHRQQRADDQVLHVVEQLVGRLRAVPCGHEVAQAVDGPFHALCCVKAWRVLLDGHVGEVHKLVVQLALLSRVLGGAEPAKPQP